MKMITSSIQDILMMYAWKDDKEFETTAEIVDYGKDKLFDFPYPFYDSKMKDQFELDFIRHFYTREIGSESIALFKLRLQDYLYLNHEKWERLYLSIDETINPFTNIDIITTKATDENEKTDRNMTSDNDRTTERIQDSEEKSEYSQHDVTKTNADDFTRALEQTPPDERLKITAKDGVGVIDYASNIQENKNTNKATQDNKVKGRSSNTSSGGSNEQSKGKQSELEEQLRAFDQQLEEHKIGRDLKQSFVEIYSEYIAEFRGIHQAMFREMEKLFLGVF